MEFPLLNITDHNWDPSRVDAELIFYELIYVDQEIFEEYHKGKLYCDCQGKVYKALDIQLSTSFWRRFFYFLPHVYKSKLIFERTELRLTVDQLRDFVLARILEMVGKEDHLKTK